MSKPHLIWRYASPAHFLPLAGRLLPALWVLAALGIAAGLTLGLFIAPTDAQQGEAYRILYLHVPAAWIAMTLPSASCTKASRSRYRLPSATTAFASKE